jgi:hypothetical protein
MVRAGLYLVVVLAAAVLLTGCAAGLSSGLVVTPMPMLFADYKVPCNRIQAPEGEVGSASKVGEAEAINVLGVVAVGDASIQSAMKSGGITKIHHVDCHVYSIMGIFCQVTMLVYGE